MQRFQDSGSPTNLLCGQTEPNWLNDSIGNPGHKTESVGDMESSQELHAHRGLNNDERIIDEAHAVGGLPIRPGNILQESPLSDTGPSRPPPARVHRALSSEGLSQSPLHIVLPTSSLIFERDVQEDIQPMQTSPSIPSHIRTENHIPPALEASSAAITDDLDPDMVEIVTHSGHQSAAANVSGTMTTEHSLSSSFFDDGRPQSDGGEEPQSMHRTTDDVRRLSFISFADVVNAEHAEATELTSSRDYFPVASFSSNSAIVPIQNRSPSPLRSPTSSHGFGTSPPTSISTSFKNLDFSPTRAGFSPGSPPLTSQRPSSPSSGNDLNIETMRQALRKTGSLEFPVSSPVGNEDA